MRKLGLAASTLLLSYQSSPLVAATWYEIRRDGQSISYMDPSRIRKTPEGVITWTKTTFSDKGQFGESYHLLQERWDCTNETRTLMTAVLYSADGTVMTTADYTGDYRAEAVIPGSVVEPQFRFVCQR